MIRIITQVSRFTMILMFAAYVLDSFLVLRPKTTEARIKRLYHNQTALIFMILANGNLVILLNQFDVQIAVFWGMEFVFLAVIMVIYRYIYKGASVVLVNHMCMLLGLGFMMLMRLNMTQGRRQFYIACAALIITAFVPLMIEYFSFVKNLGMVFGVIGLAALAVVTLFGNTTFGSNLSFSIGGITVQPSEFVKILFVFFAAAYLAPLPKDDPSLVKIDLKSEDFKTICKTTVMAALYVLVLAMAKDLGAAVIFFVTYLVMLYVSTHKVTYLGGGLVVFALAAVAGYFLFSHVQQRVAAWIDPLADPADTGYQVSQSLFAIGTGGWFGSGLCLGMPEKIPVVTKDFIFSAICEELGVIFGVCLILLFAGCFLLFMRIALQMTDSYYKLIALGLAVTLGVQVFLAIGGAIKFIPSTGVTLPLVSYGGSSLVSTMFVFAVIQGLYCRQKREEAANG